MVAIMSGVKCGIRFRPTAQSGRAGRGCCCCDDVDVYVLRDDDDVDDD